MLALMLALMLASLVKTRLLKAEMSIFLEIN